MRLIDADVLLRDVEWQADILRKVKNDKLREIADILEKGIIAQVEKIPTINPEPQWIPCSERLPDTTDFVLTINIVSQCGVYRFDGDCWLDYDGLFVNEGIRAWMPLPEPI